MSSRVAVTARSLLLAGVAAVCWAALLRSSGDLRRPEDGFDGLLVAGAAWLLTACAAWGTVAVAAVLLEAWSSGRVRVPGVVCPARLRGVVLAALGLALTSGVVAAPSALATDTDGTAAGTTAGTTAGTARTLPVPARPVGPDEGAPRTRASVVVRRGDTLWALVAARLPRGASAADVAARVGRTHAVNRAVIGPDPDHLEPGQHLRLPASPEPTSEENP